MPLTPVAPYAQLRNITLPPGAGDDNVVASDTVLVAFDLPNETDAVAQGMIEVPNGTPLAIALRNAAGGAVPSTATGKLICEFSFSGTSAGPFDYRFIVEIIERGMTVVAKGRCIYGAYADAAVARLTLNRTTLYDALYGQAGTISQNVDPQDTGISYTFPNIKLPYQKGLFRTEPNPPDGVQDLNGHSYYAMPVVVSPTISGLLVDADANDNFIDTDARDFVALTVGLPISAAPLGSYSHIVADTSDASLNLTGIDKGIAVGFLGTSDHLTFARNASPVDTTKALLIEPPEGIKLITDIGVTTAKFNPSGGFSNHGLPVGAVITDGVCIANNVNELGDTGKELRTNWYDALFVFTAHDATGRGGLYFWAHNGIAYRIGQELDFPTCVVYNKVANEKISTDPQQKKLFVGCKSGVFSTSLAYGVTNLSNVVLTREGKLNGQVVALRLDHYAADFADKTSVTCQVHGSGPADGVYLRDPQPATLNDIGAATGYGYDGWFAFDTAGPLIGYHYDGGGNTLYCVYQDAPSTFVVTHNARTSAAVDAAEPDTAEVLVPNGAHVVGIDGLGGYGACARTELGASGLFLIGAGAGNMNPDNSLVDRYGAPVAVNRVQFASIGLYIDGQQEGGTLVASTDAGPYIGGTGGGWRAMPKQSGIGGENVLGTAVGYPQTLLNRVTTRMYCWTANGLWISHSAGMWFDEVLQEKLELGPFISVLGAISAGNQGQFLDNDVTVVGVGSIGGKVAAPIASGTSGKAVYVPHATMVAKGLQDIPETGLYLRPLDERNRWKHLFMNTASASPTGRIAVADFPSIQSDNATPVATAAGKLAQATMRKYHESAIVPHDVQFDSVLAFQEMALRTLRPSHRVDTDYDTTGDGFSVNLSTTTFYARKVRFYKARGDAQVQVQTDASTVYRAALPTDANIGDGLGESVSTMLRRGKAR